MLNKYRGRAMCRVPCTMCLGIFAVSPEAVVSYPLAAALAYQLITLMRSLDNAVSCKAKQNGLLC